MDINNSINPYLSSDFHPLPLSSVCRPDTSASAFHQNSRKKRSKFIRISKPKPDPAAPKITRPCTECGRKFWSWKALFGHMRCHPERQWRGINPPPDLRRPEITSSQTSSVTEEDHEVAACLLMLAHGPAAAASQQSPSVNQATPEYSDCMRDPDGGGRFECSSCKKVFGSHQALGGHRASHKNVKGCYAITKSEGEEEGCWLGEMDGGGGHKCSMCYRVFSSGQALGGHMRCHWEKVEEDEEEEESRVCGLDLDLRLGL